MECGVCTLEQLLLIPNNYAKRVVTFQNITFFTVDMSLSVTVDPSSKKVSIDESFMQSLEESDRQELENHILQLNELNRQLVGLNADVPPPANEINKQLSVQVNKMKDSGVAALKNNKGSEGLRNISLALEMALKRPSWESTAYAIEEVVNVLSARCDGYMKQNLWPEAFDDATILTLLKPQDAKNHYRKGKCLQTIGQYSEAKTCYVAAQSTAPNDSSFKTAVQEIDGLIAKQSS